MPSRPFAALAATLAALALAVVPIGAETVAVVGADGADGTAGSSGGPGGDGDDGESVAALADAAAEDNVATALGGDGGSAGVGTPPGDAGRGGDASAEAVGNDATDVSARANGGGSGVGTTGGGGGDATATATLTTDRDTPAAVRATAEARGGDSTISGPGGRATANASTENAGSGPSSAGSTATGGAGSSVDGRDTGAAHSEALARGEGDVEAHATSFGGPGTTAVAEATSRGNGRVVATAVGRGIGVQAVAPRVRAFGSNAGSAPVRVEATSVLSAPAAGSPIVAEGRSSGGGDVRVTATLEADIHFGGELRLFDAVSGATAGRLELRQTVTRSSVFGIVSSGDVVTGLEARNPGGGDLSLDVQAFAGAGSRVGDAIIGDVVGVSENGADVAVGVVAAGDAVRVENRAADGSATPARIRGQSNGGAVAVDVEFHVLGFDPSTGVGHAIDLADVAEADTTGAISLSQTARAAWGRDSGFLDPLSGSGGAARSALTRSVEAESLALAADAFGGSGGLGTSTANGGDAQVAVDASNRAGTASARGLAEGGLGRGRAGDGGSAHAVVSARTRGDGHAVFVGVEPTSGPYIDTATARGGMGARPPSPFPRPDDRLGDGGAATSRSSGVAQGDAEVRVFDRAEGGAGGFGYSPGRHLVGPAGDGGAATSSAHARGAGESLVLARADAYGGDAGMFTTIGGRGGEADAHADARGLGRIEAWARGFGGNADGPSARRSRSAPGIGGAGHARAAGEGASGFVRAEAATGLGRLPQVRAQSGAVLAGVHVETDATATNGAALADAPVYGPFDAVAFLTGTPLAADAASATARNAGVAQLFAESPGGGWNALGRWESIGDAAAPLASSTELEIVLGGLDARSRVVFAVFDIDVLGDAFGGLDFALERNGVEIDAAHLATPDDVIAYFQDAVFDLAAAAGDTLLARFDGVVGGGSRVSMGAGFATIVPEPGTGALLAFGLAVLARRTPRSRR